MDKERLPRWGWLLVGLFGASLLAQVVNAVLISGGILPERYQVITVITAMSPVLIYVGVWYDEDRQHYWDNSSERIVGDVVFILAGAAVGSSMALLAVVDLGTPSLLQDLVAMGSGFLLSWGLFWWRNPDLYTTEAGS